MQATGFILNINSEQPERLAAFYRDVVGLPPNPGIGDSAFLIGDTSIVIDGHSDVHGAAKEPARVLINFFVDDAAAAQKDLEAKGVRFIRTLGKEYWGHHLHLHRPGRELLPGHRVPRAMTRASGG